MNRRLLTLIWMLLATAFADHSATLLAQPATTSPSAALEQWVARTEALVPRDAKGFTTLAEELAAAAEAIEGWGVQLATYRTAADLGSALAITRQLLEAKRRVDVLLDTTLGLRQQFSALDEKQQRDAIRRYLRATSQLIDLSGRLRYLLHDALNTASSRFCKSTPERQRLVELLAQYRSTIGATMAVEYLFDAPVAVLPRVREAKREAHEELQRKVLRLAAESGETELLPAVADFLLDDATAPGLVVAAAETVREIGLPQSPRPGTPDDVPPPAITPKQLLDRLEKLPTAQLSTDERKRRDTLIAWLEVRVKQGLTEPTFRLGRYEVRPGDWLLMRNPSPYNLFTDLSPGLFTHVGVVALEDGVDGVRRMVIVDLVEHGTRMPATCVETFLPRSLHYVFLRHPDAKAAQAMGEAARSVIGNEIEFDLTFKTSRVLELKKQTLAGRKIQTYCAGFLLLCALQTDADRREFFPITEFPAGGQTSANLGKLGLSVGEDFISPTGALFSTKLELIGRREPMYEATREIEEAVFDHFAKCLEQKTLSPAPDLFNELRVRVAEMSQDNPLLAQALAQAANVSAGMDLVSAAKAAAVVETLDEIAYGASGDFTDARNALRAGPIDELRRQGSKPEEIAAIEEFRRQHADLYAALQAGKLSPRALRVALVKHYAEAGRQELEQQFFSAKP